MLNKHYPPISKELEFVYIALGKKFLTRKEAEEYRAKENECRTRKLNKENGTRGRNVKKLKNGKESKNEKGNDCWIAKDCSVCGTHIEEDNGDMVGYFGILPVGFCIYCISSVTDMVIQLQGYDNIDVLKEMIVGLEES